jgi:PAS domain S-box-containing protein
MFKNLKIGVGYKITVLVITVVLISVLSVGYIAFNLNKKYIEDRYKESIEVVASLKSQKIEAFFEKIKANIQFGSQLEVVKTKCLVNVASTTPKDTFRLIENNPVNKPDSVQVVDNQPVVKGQETVLTDVFQQVAANYDVKNIYLTDKNGRILFSLGSKDENNITQPIGAQFNESDPNTITVGRDSVYFGNRFKIGNDDLMHVSAPVRDNLNNILGVIIYEIKIKYVFDLVNDNTGLGETGEIILAKSFINEIIYLNEPRLAKKSGNSPKRIYLNSKREIALQKATQEQSGNTFIDDLDYRDEPVLAIPFYLPTVDWGLVVKIDKKEIYQPTNDLRNTLIITGLSVFLISLLIGLIFSRSILVRPLLTLKEVVNLLSKGVLPEKVNRTLQTNDEISEMGDQLNDLVQNLKTKANFARSIGQDNLHADFKPTSDQDTLGVALLTMRDSILMAAERDDERNWIVKGLAEIGDILPSIATIEDLGDLVTEFVTNKIGAIQGAFYTVDDSNPANVFIELKASFAYNKRKYLKGKFKFGQGLIGQSAIEKDTIVRTEIPDDYMTITSGILGDKKPKCILITPLITNETVYGVLEFAGFEKFSNREIDFVKEISEIIARTLFNIKVKENTENLLAESQKMGRELQVQQEVLRQNAEIMEATQEELQRTNRELENQINEVQRANDKTRLLLENSSEVITIYEPNATIRYISPSVEKILGYSQDEMIGIRDVIYIHQLGVESFEQMFRELLDDPTEKVTIQYSYLTKWGDRIWLESTGINLLADPAIQGIVVNSRDITERRAAEKEQRLRGQMQALSENSPDLITRISKEGKVFYINPTIENYTGKNKENYLQKDLQELELGNSILNSWNDVLKDVLTKNHKINVDMDFPSIMGDRIMQVNAIPEFNDQNNLESVLLVSHDITERKLIELEITQKNRKISESINYAKRIQEAILPDTTYIRQFLPESFILYKPRDVVSGDFPWFLQLGDDIYIAAVDCTGHGVPGALISLIGFFLLNNIVKLQDKSSPGEILDLLDEEVTKTLKQDEIDASTKDGMDISLCKINRRKMQIEYAGAHRPLYYLTQEDLHEIKGNKFPIGGAQYKNRARFTNTVINYKDGDSIYLFSDGITDQFGGPKNKKFSPRRVREIIQENADSGLAEISKALDQEFETWRGNNKQTDDVLLIGIKL